MRTTSPASTGRSTPTTSSSTCGVGLGPDLGATRLSGIDPDGPLGQAQWAKTRYGLATQTLPHGYCGLPVQKSCPHANACLTCPVFLTGPEFLPELREHRGRTLTLIDTACATGQERVAQMNQQVLANLDRMIHEVDRTAEAEAGNAG